MLGNVPQFFDVEVLPRDGRAPAQRGWQARHDVGGDGEGAHRRRDACSRSARATVRCNALDNALRKDLGRYQGFISDLELVDYKVRILTGGTDAVTRVLIESRDGVGNRWFTVGVSPNIVDASFEALLDSINYKLIRDGAAAPS